jgi:hypothetical protein
VITDLLLLAEGQFARQELHLGFCNQTNFLATYPDESLLLKTFRLAVRTSADEGVHDAAAFTRIRVLRGRASILHTWLEGTHVESCHTVKEIFNGQVIVKIRTTYDRRTFLVDTKRRDMGSDLEH